MVTFKNLDAPPVVPLSQRFAYDADGNITYEAWADPIKAGETDGEDKVIWCIRKHTWVDGVRTKSEWCDGNSQFDNVWTTYASHTYM